MNYSKNSLNQFVGVLYSVNSIISLRAKNNSFFFTSNYSPDLQTQLIGKIHFFGGSSNKLSALNIKGKQLTCMVLCIHEQEMSL